MRIPGSGKKRTASESNLAAGEASRFAADAPGLVDQAAGVAWYDRPGNDVDLAAYTLCLLRRARSGERAGTMHGDEAVRTALAAASPEAVVWLASRAISYLDETGFPEGVEPWFREEAAT